MTIKVEKHGEKTYFTAERRGVSYCASQKRDGKWEVHSRRLALGRGNVGSWKFYDTVEDLVNANAAFFGLEQFVDQPRKPHWSDMFGMGDLRRPPIRPH